MAVQRQLGRPSRTRSGASAARSSATSADSTAERGRAIVTGRVDAAGSPARTRPARRRPAPRRSGCEVVVEADEPPVALGPQLTLAHAGGARGPPGRRRRPAGPIGARPTVAARHVGRRHPPGRRRDLAPGVPDAGRTGDDATGEPDQRAASCSPPQPADGPRRAGGQPGGLDHRHRQRGAGDPAALADGAADRFGRPEHPVEPGQVDAGPSAITAAPRRSTRRSSAAVLTDRRPAAPAGRAARRTRAAA